jgi:hypothetical protein
VPLLKDLINDIYAPLEDLSKGVPLPIKEKDLDLTLSRIKESILSWANPEVGEKSSFRLRMSNVGRPARQLWYEKRDQSENSIDAATQIKFLYGHILEEIVLMLVRMTDHVVTDEQKEVKLLDILGHMDCKINGEVVDVKTASRFAFNKFKNGNLSEDDSFGYLGQLHAYETAEKTNHGGFLVINKESGELCFYQPDDLEKPNVKTKIKTLKKVLGLDEQPDFCYQPIPEGKKGNMKLPKGCVYCKYKFDCHKDSNEGKGLRIFKYANGPTYLTTVEALPNVEEIIYESPEN